MNVNSSLSENLTKYSNGTDLLIEQESWGSTGSFTKLMLLDSLLNFINPDEYEENSNNCGGSDNIYEPTVYVYTFTPNLAYSFFITGGTYEQYTVENVYLKQAIEVNGETKIQIKYPIDKVISTEWLGDVTDFEGEVISEPACSIDDNNNLIIGRENVAGVVVLLGTVIRHKYKLKIDITEDDDETEDTTINLGVAYAKWDGGIKGIRLTTPPGFLETGGECGNGNTYIEDDDPKGPPRAYPEDHEIIQDYCTKVITSE